MYDTNNNFPLTGTLHNNFGSQAIEDQNKHEDYKRADEQKSDETSSLGHMPEEVMDIDAAIKSMGLVPDTDARGPTELSDAEDLNRNVNS
jgi:hypothetical protein